uniref:Uncharacterized protein n=1 Tax=Cacopsylla melanoneura TaxID=428564 RepID=A0A8D8TDD2_9HEMI
MLPDSRTSSAQGLRSDSILFLEQKKVSTCTTRTENSHLINSIKRAEIIRTIRRRVITFHVFQNKKNIPDAHNNFISVLWDEEQIRGKMFRRIRRYIGEWTIRICFT